MSRSRGNGERDRYPEPVERRRRREEAARGSSSVLARPSPRAACSARRGPLCRRHRVRYSAGKSERMQPRHTESLNALSAETGPDEVSGCSYRPNRKRPRSEATNHRVQSRGQSHDHPSVRKKRTGPDSRISSTDGHQLLTVENGMIDTNDERLRRGGE